MTRQKSKFDYPVNKTHTIDYLSADSVDKFCNRLKEEVAYILDKEKGATVTRLEVDKEQYDYSESYKGVIHVTTSRPATEEEVKERQRVHDENVARNKKYLKGSLEANPEIVKELLRTDPELAALIGVKPQ